jgi:hypothetical protein
MMIHHKSRTVSFNDIIIIYAIDGNEDRRGFWVEDSTRFKIRIVKTEAIISFIFDSIHRDKMRIFISNCK